MIITKILTAAALLLGTTSAQSIETYKFSYNNAAGTLSGRFTGTLQADGNTILISTVLDFLRFNGVAGPSLPFVTTLSSFLNIAPTTPFAKLDGSNMDVLACTNLSCSGELVLYDGLGIYAGAPAFFSSAAFGGSANFYADGNGTIAAVPEPATWALLITGFGLTGAAVRRRRRAVAVAA